MKATVTGKYFLEDGFAIFFSAVFSRFQISQEDYIEIRHSFNLVAMNNEQCSFLIRFQMIA